MSDTCHLCPRRCGADRSTASGFCGASDRIEVASACIHRGEEPPLDPIVNIFFAHCNLQCIYCQNWQISKVESGQWKAESPETIADKVCEQFSTFNFQLSTPLVGFVTAAHYADRLPEIIEAIRAKGANPTFVYNSSGYESVDTLRSLEGLIDIYLPDLKYMDSDLAARYSHAPDYPEVAATALLEMKRQVGGSLKVDGDGQAYRGIIVRHLVLPGAVDNSLRCLDWLADHFDPFTLHLSLMAQYFPPRTGLPAPLDRTLTAEEYAAVTAHADALGFTCGWTQELTAQSNYRPDFTNTGNPFETNTKISTH